MICIDDARSGALACEALETGRREWRAGAAAAARSPAGEDEG